MIDWMIHQIIDESDSSRSVAADLKKQYSVYMFIILKMSFDNGAWCCINCCYYTNRTVIALEE